MDALPACAVAVAEMADVPLLVSQRQALVFGVQRKP